MVLRDPFQPNILGQRVYQSRSPSAFWLSLRPTPYYWALFAEGKKKMLRIYVEREKPQDPDKTFPSLEENHQQTQPKYLIIRRLDS